MHPKAFLGATADLRGIAKLFQVALDVRHYTRSERRIFVRVELEDTYQVAFSAWRES